MFRVFGIRHGPSHARQRGSAVEIGPQARAVLRELPSSRFRRVGFRRVGPERAHGAIEARQREACRDHEVAALRQVLTAGRGGDVGVRQRAAVTSDDAPSRFTRPDDRTHGRRTRWTCLRRSPPTRTKPSWTARLIADVTSLTVVTLPIEPAAVGGNRLQLSPRPPQQASHRRRRSARAWSTPLAVTLRNELAVVATLWLARYALSPLSFRRRDEHDDGVAARAVGGRIGRHCRDRCRLRIVQRVGERTIVVPDAAEAGRNERRRCPSDVTVGDGDDAGGGVGGRRDHDRAGRRGRLRVACGGHARRVDGVVSAPPLALHGVSVAVEQPVPRSPTVTGLSQFGATRHAGVFWRSGSGPSGRCCRRSQPPRPRQPLLRDAVARRVEIGGVAGVVRRQRVRRIPRRRGRGDASRPCTCPATPRTAGCVYTRR